MIRPLHASAAIVRSSQRTLVLLASTSTFLLASRAHAEPQDAEAKRIAGTAISRDYMSGKYTVAKRKLESALTACGLAKLNSKKRPKKEPDKCSGKVRARLYRDLGVVYLGGLGKPEEGREALARAIQADPAIRLNKDLTTPEIAQAFREVGGGGVAEEEPPARKKKQKAEAEEGGEEDAQAEGEEDAEDAEGEGEGEGEEEGEASDEEPSDAGSVLPNWLSFSLQQELLLHGASKKVCYSGDYVCFGVGGAEFASPIYEGAGNQADGGLGVATTRILLGFERLFFGNVLLGGRLGLAFRGAPTGRSGDKFLPLHLELRGSYFFGDAPFAHQGFRPYATLAMGIAEVDGHVAVEYYADEAGFRAGQTGKLDAWRKAGKSFVAPSFGTHFAFGSASALTAEFRVMVMLGASGLAPALSIGYAHGL